MTDSSPLLVRGQDVLRGALVTSEHSVRDLQSQLEEAQHFQPAWADITSFAEKRWALHVVMRAAWWGERGIGVW
jgi:hypothetical protein